MRHLESKLQSECVKWFRLQYPKLALNLFAIPNGGARDVITGAILKREGVTAGVADLFLAVPRYKIGGEEFCGGLFIEMKAGKGRLTPGQVAFREALEPHGYKFVVAYSWHEAAQAIAEHVGFAFDV